MLLGLRNIISEVVVSTRLSSGSWLGAWRHQVRWARTIRLSGGAGYAGLPITYASLWVLIAALFGMWWIALPLLAIRLAMAMVCGGFLLGSLDVWKYCYAIPLRDLCGVAVWAAGLVARHGGMARSTAKARCAKEESSLDKNEPRACYNGRPRARSSVG